MSALAVGSVMLIAAIGGWLFVGGIAVACIIASRWFGRRTLLLIPLAVIAAGWVWWNQPGEIDPRVADQRGWRLQVTSMPAMRAQGWSFEAKLRDGPGKGQRLMVYTSDATTITFGDQIYVTGSFQAKENLKDPGYRGYLTGLGVGGQIFAGRIEVDRHGHGVFVVLNRIRQRAVNRALNAAPGDTGSLIAGLVTGDDGKLAEQTDLEFRRAGLTHLTAVSGANLGFALALVISFGRFTRRRQVELLVLGTSFVWTYAALVGLSPPTLRAALLITVIMGGNLAGRPIDPLSLSVLAGVAQIGLRPSDAHSISFLLSVAASIGISAGLGRYPRSGKLGLSDYVGATLYAQAATAIVIAATFGQLSLLSIAANIVAAPVMILAFPLSVLALILLAISETIGQAFVLIAEQPVSWLLHIANIYGRAWSVISLPTIDQRWMLSGVILVLLALAVIGGEGQYIRRNLRARRTKVAVSR
jgi:ComEC/Rec2-related protein